MASLSREKAGELRSQVEAIALASGLEGINFWKRGAPAITTEAGGSIDILSAGEIKPSAAFWALIDPFRNLAGVFPANPLVIVNPVTSDHTRYFGWSDKRLIETAEFSFASTSESNEGLLPQRATDGYIWFAVPEAAGYPGSLHIDNGPLDQIGVFVRQAGTVDDLNGDPHIVGVSFDMQTAALSGDEIELGY